MTALHAILLVEDSPTQAAELRALIEQVGFSVHEAASLAQALAQLAEAPVAAVLLDLCLPDASGLTVLRRVREGAPGAPIVVLTRLDDEGTGVRAVQEGAQDYLVKGHADGDAIVRSIRYAMERKRAERALKQSRDDLAAILNQLRVGTMMTDAAGRLTFVSRGCHPFVERPEADVLGRAWREVLVMEAAEAAALHAVAEQPAAARRKVAVHLETPSGRRYWLDVEVYDDPNDPDRRIFALYDLTEVRDLRRLLDERAQFQDLVGGSATMMKVFELIRQVAAVDTTVLIEGETGTGKELAARAIHSLSPRQSQPFITVNSAGLTDSLLASQLFGHKRGAFTGAIADHKGFFEAADGGTLLLDEIGDISESVQASLLRVLEGREIVRLGESTPHKVDVRFLAATHRNLAEAVQAQRFRADLFYRLRVARIRLPPLRERREDIPRLVAAFLRQFRAATGKPVETVSEPALGRLMRYPWPGNVRELRGAIEFGVVRCTRSYIAVEDLPPELDAGAWEPAAHPPEAPSSPPMRAGDAAAERARILDALERAGGNRTEAAKRLGMGRATFYRRLEALQIQTKTPSGDG